MNLAAAAPDGAKNLTRGRSALMRGEVVANCAFSERVPDGAKYSAEHFSS